VISLKLDSDGKTDATVEVAGQYAPIRQDMQAILRQKTLLGETYVQLIPTTNSGPYLADGAHLPDSQVKPSVTLDDILSAFDPQTRKAFQVWQQAVAGGINGRGEQINSDFASLQPFVEHAGQLVSVLDEQEGAVKDLVHNTGVVFDALAGKDHQLEQFIVNGEKTFHAAAEASNAFAQAFVELPEFEKRSQVALKELDKFQTVANPYLDEFRPTEVQLAKLLQAAKPFAPQLDRFLTAVGPLTKAAAVGLPNVKKTLNLTEPVLENLRPVLHNLDPFLQYTGEYVPELQAFFANLAAASQFSANNSNINEGSQSSPKQHLLTTMAVLSPESLAIYPSRVGTNRANPYFLPGAFSALGSGGLPVFSAGACSNTAPALSGTTNEYVTAETNKLIEEFKVANKAGSTTNEVAAPACNQQGPSNFNGKSSQFPKVTYEGK